MVGTPLLTPLLHAFGLKQAFQENSNLLEQVVEPLDHHYWWTYHKDQLAYAWKVLCKMHYMIASVDAVLMKYTVKWAG